MNLRLKFHMLISILNNLLGKHALFIRKFGKSGFEKQLRDQRFKHL